MRASSLKLDGIFHTCGTLQQASAGPFSFQVSSACSSFNFLHKKKGCGFPTLGLPGSLSRFLQSESWLTFAPLPEMTLQ